MYALTFLVFYPRVIAIVDEDAYLTQAYLFRAGSLSYDDSPVPAPHMTVNMAGHQVSKYPPGNSLFLLPFTLLGWRWIFLSGLLLALAGTWLFRLTLKKLMPDVDPAWSLLYLSYPTVLLYSRTIMSDLLAATLVLAAFYLLILGRRWLLAAGLVLGFACLVRYSNVVLVPVFLILAIVRTRHRLRACLFLLVGILPFAVLIAGYNSYAFGGPLQFPTYLTGQLSPAFFFRNLGYYALNLLLLYPLMLFAPLATDRKNRLLLMLPAYTILTFYCFFSYIHAVSSLAERLLVGMRYLLPAFPFLIMAYVATLHRLESRLRYGRWFKFALITTMLILGVALQLRHNDYLKTQDRYRRLLYSTVPESALLICNKDISELVSYAWGWRQYRHFIEFNTPIPFNPEPRTPIPGPSTPLYAALLQKPGKKNLVEATAFQSLLFNYPDRKLVLETKEPYQLSLYLLKPAQTPDP